MDYIDITNLEVFAHHGVLPEENQLGQKFILTVRLYYVTSHAGMRDDLSKGVDYSEVAHDITVFFQQNRWQLIETCAERLSRHLLLQYPPLHKIDLSISKPWAPIGLPLDAVSVTIHRGWHPVFIALGANEGDRLANLCQAIDEIADTEGIRLRKISSFIESDALGRPGPPYLNAVLRLDTVLLPRELLRQLQAIEDRLGRTRHLKWGKRTIDLDMIFYDQIISDSPTLILPHPRYRDRSFVTGPLAEIEPYWRDPESGERMIDVHNSLFRS